MRIEVTVYRDSVTIEGTRILRPSHIAPSQWLQMWERALPLFKVPTPTHV